MKISDQSDGGQAALVQLRAYLSQRLRSEDARLPPERELCDLLGVSRGNLRKALSVLEAEGQLWRHVGKGTFIGSAPSEEVVHVADIAARTNPTDLMRARLIIEPELAREAALHAAAEDVAAMRACIADMRQAESWRAYETLDNVLHRQVAQAARNPVLLGLFDALNSIRRAVVWGRLRPEPSRPPVDHHSFGEHDRIVDAIAERDLTRAAAEMRLHLQSVASNLVPLRDAAE